MFPVKLFAKITNEDWIAPQDENNSAKGLLSNKPNPFKAAGALCTSQSSNGALSSPD